MDMSWLATEAKTLHSIFQNAFYVMISTFLVLAIVIEYFKFPLGGVPAIPQLVGRVFIACLLMVATPEIMNMLSHVTDGFVGEIGKLVELDHVLDRLQDKLGELSWSWVSIKDTLIIVISYISFFVLYITVYLADAVFLFSWMLLYIFSPFLVALFIFPLTANATKMLYKSMVEVCAWKIIWTCMVALLWSMALSDINKPGANVSFLTVILVNIMLVFSVVIAPKITSAFLGAGISGVANGFGDALLNASQMTPQGMLNRGKQQLSLRPNKSEMRRPARPARKKIEPAENKQSQPSDDDGKE